MAEEYIKIKLSHGQGKRQDFSDITLSDGSFVWVGEEGMFDETAVLGKRGKKDPPFDKKYSWDYMTQEEIDEYNALLNAPDPGAGLNGIIEIKNSSDIIGLKLVVVDGRILDSSEIPGGLSPV